MTESETMPAETGRATDPGSGLRRFIMEWIPIIVGALIVAAVVRLFVFQAYSIPSGSMVPTLKIGDRVVVNKLSYDFNDIGWGDIVVFARPDNAPRAPGEEEIDDLIKRVMALPGDRIQFHNGDVYVNNMRVQETYLAEQGVTWELRGDGIPHCIDALPGACTVPEGRVFMMGDNRSESTDSRRFGPVEIDSIVGRSAFRVWPPNEATSF